MESNYGTYKTRCPLCDGKVNWWMILCRKEKEGDEPMKYRESQCSGCSEAFSEAGWRGVEEAEERIATIKARWVEPIIKSGKRVSSSNMSKDEKLKELARLETYVDFAQKDIIFLLSHLGKKRSAR